MVEGYENAVANGIDVVMYVKAENASDINVNSLKVFPIYSQDEYDAGTLEHVDMRILSTDYDIIVIGEYFVEVNKVIE